LTPKFSFVIDTSKNGGHAPTPFNFILFLGGRPTSLFAARPAYFSRQQGFIFAVFAMAAFLRKFAHA
jgi:hypothetical protein